VPHLHPRRRTAARPVAAAGAHKKEARQEASTLVGHIGRPGDIATCYSDPTKAERELGWKAERGLAEMMRDAWRWQQMNPGGMGSLPLSTNAERA
jgi:UDP-glucose 4-epimerase